MERPINLVTINGADDIRAAMREHALSKAEGPDRELIAALYVDFDELNARFWQGELEPAPIMVTPPTSPRAFADAAEYSGFGCRQQMRIRASVARGEHNQDKPAGTRPFWRMRAGHNLADRQRWLRDLVLHEMVHLWLNQNDAPLRHEHRGHGRPFTAECNRMSDEMGLPPVVIRRRKSDPVNLSISSEWPHNVRPGGEHGEFYGDLWELVPAVRQLEEAFSGFAALCAAWEDERTSHADHEQFCARYGLRPGEVHDPKAAPEPVAVEPLPVMVAPAAVTANRAKSPPFGINGKEFAALCVEAGTTLAEVAGGMEYPPQMLSRLLNGNLHLYDPVADRLGKLIAELRAKVGAVNRAA